MKTYSNINDFLIDHLFLIDEANGYYFKYYAPNHRHTIPFTALAGHTVESFQKLAEKEGWLEDNKEQKYLNQQASEKIDKPLQLQYMDQFEEDKPSLLVYHTPDQYTIFAAYHHAVITIQQLAAAIDKSITTNKEN